MGETRIEAALREALDGGDRRTLYDAIERSSGLPGPRPNLDFLRSVGATVARAGGRGAKLADEMLEQKHPALHRVAVFAIAAPALERGADAKKRSRVVDRLHDLSDEGSKEKRDAIIDALADVVAAAPDEVLPMLAKMTDGYLHAFVALEAITDARVLERAGDASELLARLGEAFDLADGAPRSADRAQGVRLLRQGFPTQIARIAPRFEEVVAFVEARTDRERPETRAVIDETITRMRKILGEARADELRRRHAGTAKPPRDPSRIVHGTRKRSRGR